MHSLRASRGPCSYLAIRGNKTKSCSALQQRVIALGIVVNGVFFGIPRRRVTVKFAHMLRTNIAEGV